MLLQADTSSSDVKKHLRSKFTVIYQLMHAGCSQDEEISSDISIRFNSVCFPEAWFAVLPSLSTGVCIFNV